MTPDEVYADALLGRRVLARNNRHVGRIEEMHAEQRGDYFDIVEFVIGSAGLLERLNVGVRRILGRRRRGVVARWDQIDISDPKRPRLTCSVEELQTLEA
jgi:hypothetical protein